MPELTPLGLTIKQVLRELSRIHATVTYDSTGETVTVTYDTAQEAECFFLSPITPEVPHA